MTAEDNSLQAILPILYNTSLDKGYLDRHNRTFHASVVDTSGKILGDWSGYFCGASTSIWGNAYGVNENSTYQYISRSRGADAVIKKLGNRIQLPYIKHSGQGNNGMNLKIPLDGHTKLFIEKIIESAGNDATIAIRGDGKLLGQYKLCKSFVSNISIDISGMSTLEFNNWDWVDPGYCTYEINNLVIE